MIVHAGLIARQVAGAWRGVLILGPSGVGKSDLALRALAEGFSLVADDRTLLFLSANRLFGRAPDALHGLIEARGLGVLRQAARRFAPVSLAVRCKSGPADGERLPPEQRERLMGVDIPLVDIWPIENSATAKISRAIEHLGPGA